MYEPYFLGLEYPLSYDQGTPVGSGLCDPRNGTESCDVMKQRSYRLGWYLRRRAGPETYEVDFHLYSAFENPYFYS